MRYPKYAYKRNQIRYVFFWVFFGALNLNVNSYRSENHSFTSEVNSYNHSKIIHKNGVDLEQSSYVFRFKHSIYNVTIPENSVGKTYALQMPDEDKAGIKVMPNIDAKYRIVSGDRDKLFKAEERLVGGFAFLAIRTRTSNVILNREKMDEYRLVIKAFGTQLESSGKQLYESETVVSLKVLDRNDLSPLFYPTEYSKTLPEDMPLHKSILQVNAEDADLGINGEIYYSFLHDNDNFAVHPTSGVITLTRRLNFSEKTIHELIILANDRVSATNHRLNQASKAKVSIRIEPVNLYAPDIYVRTLPYVAEGANANVYGIIRVSDKDQGIHGEIKSVELVSGDPDGHFRLISTNKNGEYYIEIHKLLDREQTPQGYNLTFRAEDRGLPPQSSYKTIPVHLSDANDNSPVFNRQIYEVSVPETSPPNTPVIRLKVTDQDQEKNSQVFLEIVGGNEGGEFRINPDTGMLYTQKNLDAETKAFYTLTVSAIDQGNVGMRKQSSAKVKINVQDTNDNDPVFDIKNSTVWIDENEPAGTTVIKISARDKDSGENAYISYSIANLNEVPFDIDHFSGVLRTSKLIDYETMRREYVLSIRASDWGLPFRRQTEMELLVKINDVNDNRPQFERIDCIGHIPRQSSVGTDILTLSAIDFDAGNYITYRMVSGNEDGCFNLDQTAGVMSIGCDLTDVGVSQREVNVTATDGTHFADILTIQINLINEKRGFSINAGANAVLGRSIISQDGGSFECRDTGIARRQAEILAAAEKNNMPGRDYNLQDDFAMIPIRYGENVHAPEFVDFPLELKINETVQLGETVSWIKARDRDLGYNGKLVYGISGGDYDSVFRIDPDTGELQIIGYLDRERQDEYVLNVTVYDLGKPQKSSSKMFPITVLDQNDNPPKFEKSLASFRVSEHAKNGTIIFRLKANDADTGDNAKVTFTMITETNNFQVEAESGIVYVSHPLDREEKEIYELQIRATDGGLPIKLSADANILVIVDDVNDNAPEFTLSEYTFRVREDIPKGTVIAIVSATDADIGSGGEVLYTFSDESYSEDKLFKIDKYTGTIRTQGYLDFEERQLHSLCVRAIDRGIPALSSEATVIIEIIDVNENRHAPEFEDFVLVGSVTENQPADTHVMSIVAKDADPPGPDSRVTYSIRGGDGLGIFAIDSEGSLRTMSLLDIESKSCYWLTVCAQDQAVVPLHSCIEVFIQVKNENDNVPLTDSPVYYPLVAEGSPSGVEILQLKAKDRDVDGEQHITYRIISGNPEGFFTINGTTGVISTTARKLDRENQSEHIMEILITDGGVPPLSSTTRVIVCVDDINDQSPEFDQRFYKVQIPATAKIDKPLFQVLAIDNDSGDNGRVTYAIKSGKGKAKFRIDSDTGVIFAAKPFDPDAEYDLAIRAEDNGEQKRMHTTRVNVIVVPVPETSQHAPVIKSVNQEVDVTESDRPGFLVTLVQASDEDNDQLWFDIIDGGDPRNEFYIGRDNGNVLLTKSLDWEVQKEYNLTISVTDGAHTITTQLFVHVIDVNDHRPEFSDSVYKIDISENIDEESEILQLHATDMDEDKKIFYTLHAAQSPISLTLFRIDSITGNVIVTQRLDRERISEHVLVAIAKDQGTPAKRNYAKIIITVHDHNDHHPEFTSKIIQGKIFESAVIGTQVAQLFAIDRDLGDNAKITYSIVSGNIGNAFDIDPVMGVISVNKELDINVMPEYMLQVKASDHGKPALSSQVPVHIIITMAENDPPRFLKDQVFVEIYENRPIGSYVTQIEARSTSTINYEIISGNNDDVFQINPSTGVLTTKDIVDYEKVKLVNLTIRATNMASISSQSSAIIHILDQNDNSPHFLQSSYWGEISESAPLASLILSKGKDNVTDVIYNQSLITIKYPNKGNVQSGLIANQSPLVIKAVDLDSGLNALLRYDIVESLPKRYFHIDSSTGVIKTVMLLDYEKMPYFEFHVKVTDLGTPKLSSDTTTKVQITVTNVNDCAPIFERNEYNVTLLLPTYENVVIIHLNATDPDGSEISSIRYDIIEGNEANAFAMNSDTGIITTRDVERIEPLYKLHVRASDGKYSKVAYVNINVETSENYGLFFKKAAYEGVISENSTKITTISTVNVMGSKLNEHIEYRILNPTTLFRIGLTSGAIESTGRIFDREVCDHYELIVEARSQSQLDSKPGIAHVVVNVTVLDINDNCPMFVNLPYYAVVSVDDPKGSFVTKVHAVDLDSFENGEVRYEMKRGHGELFKVDRKTGDVTLKQSLEGHNRDYELLIAAYDGAVTPCSTEVGVHVKVIDKSMPIFSKQFYSVSVSESIGIYTPLSVTIQADSPLGRKLIYTIAKGNELEEFALDFNTGSITVGDELDYERTQSYDLIVRATDSVSGVFAEVPVSVMVLDVNDCPPEIEQDIYNISVSEGSPFGTSLLKIIARDNDTGINKNIIFAIDSNDENKNSGYFHLDPLEGILYLKKSLDHETQSVHHFTVIATDGGSPSLTSTAHVWISVIDINDNAPKFEEPSYTCTLSIHAKRGQFVTIVRASDPDSVDQSNLVYKIAQGNEMQTYNIGSSTGIITLINMNNFAEHQMTILNISVTDGIYTSFTRVKINILPGNLNSPVFVQSAYEAKLNENQLPGRHVITVSAIDKDLGEFGTITYDIMSDQLKEYFTIDKTNGVIETKVSLDREICSSYDIPVIATDSGGRSGFTNVKVKVIDENDNVPIFVLEEYHAVINGNLQTFIPFIKVKAVDKDENQNSAIRYSLYEPENYKIQSLFEISEVNGSIYLTTSASKYVNQIFEFFIRASDCGTPSLHNDVSISVLIVNDSIKLPTFEQKERKQFISELSTPGTLITRFHLVGNFTGKYKIISHSDDKQFSINEEGALTLSKTLDREQKDMHTIAVLAEIGNPSFTAVSVLILHVQDENDNAPIFESSPYSIFLAENVDKGTSIIKVAAHDSDQGSNGEIRYFLGDDIGDIANVFDIDVYTGWITTLVTMDREKRSEYRFQVIAADHGQPKHLGKATVIVKLKDYNDNSLIFKSVNYTTSAGEDALPGTVLLQLSVTDKDTDANTAVEYYITSGDPLSQFHIQETGDLFIAKPLDREKIPSYLLNIIATDGKFTTSTNVTVIINDVNDNPPYCQKYRYKEIINELILPGTFVLEIIASDADEEANSKLRFYLTGNGSEDFALNKDTGVLQTAREIDRETVSRYYLTAHVQDRDQLSWECISKIEIIVADINDNAPTFSMEAYTLTLPEDAEIGTLATKVHATDNDVGVNRKIRYTFLASGNGTFKISEDSGIITLIKILDRESIATYNLTVIATDQGSPKLTTMTTLIVNVQDINDNPPEFTMRHYFATVAENSDIDQEVITVLATSRDTGINAEIYYSIIGGNEQKKFSINRNTGSVSISGELDYEKTKHFLLTIQAVDGGVPPLSNLASLNITITDVNDNNPQFLQNSYTARIREDALVGDKILQVKAFDADSDQNGQLRFNIERGDRFNQFEIDKDTGYLSVAGGIDRESVSNYVLEIRARDNGNPELSSYVHVNIDISDANDNPPLFTKSNYTVIVQEDKQLGHVLIKFDIIDADTIPNSSPYTFDFRSGNDGGAFRLEQDGTLRTATRFNHKVRSTYKMLIRVFDNGTPPLYSDAWVTVKVIEESQYPPVITPIEILINSFLDEFPGGAIGRVYATDQDQYDSLIYHLVPTAGVLFSPHTLFNISKDSGFLNALPNLDVGEYRVNVTVSDGKFTAFAIIKITVDLITKEMLENAIILRFSNITPEDFILSHRKGFVRSIRTAMRTRQKDVIIISVQRSNEDFNEVGHHRRNLRNSNFKSKEECNLDVVFTVRKQQVNPNADGYFSSKDIMSTITDNIEEIEEATNLIIDEVVKTKCNQEKCVYGLCKDKIVLDRKNINTIATDVTSLVSAVYEHVNECKCQQGYGGEKCDEAVNSCASKPCPLYKLCVPEIDLEGYQCVCPHGYTGSACDRDVKKCLDSACYNAVNPVSFSGKSYAHYKIDRMVGKKTLEDQLIFTLRVRTLQQTGNLMYASGKVDYNILEISNGVVQYRFDLGSGEGLISVSSIYVSDGEWHEVKLERERNSAKLVVDGKHVAQGSAPGVNGILNLQSNDIFLGAEVHPHPSVLGFEDVQRGFIGCMDDIQLAKEPVPLHMTGSSTVAVLKRFANVEFTCDGSAVLVPLGICGTQPCFNGGICKNIGHDNFECQCHSRFTGPFCKDDLDPCASSPCLFGGKCRSEGSGNYSCNCPLQMSGKRCEFGRFCSPNPCKNGGLCEEGDHSAHCMCRGYSGETCEIDVDECENQPCGSGATCINEAGSFRCICPPDLTGASCGDPLYSNSITTQLRNLPLEDMIGIGCTIMGVVLVIFSCLCYFVCSRKSLNQRPGNVNNDPRKEITLNAVLQKENYKRSSKLSNLEVQQRPQSYTASSNDIPFPVNTMLVNNLDILRSYGSAGDELENVPPEYQKLNCTNQHININGTTSSDIESIHKQTWSDQMQLKTFSDNKLNNERKIEHYNNHTVRLASLKPTTTLNSKLLHVNLPNINSQSAFEDAPNNHGQYHWDCSDWARRSQNPLPDITEVPGVEVPDSSSFHSNESNESHPKSVHVPLNIGPVDPIRDIETLNEDIESEYAEQSECESGEKPLSMCFETHMPLNGLNPLDSGSEEYRFNTGDTYHRHPNTYLPPYNIQSETDGETSLSSTKLLNGHIERSIPCNIDSDEEEISGYGFPNRRRRREISNTDLIANKYGPSENISLLDSYHPRDCESNSDLSAHICEIEDSEFEDALPPRDLRNTARIINASKSGPAKKSVNWSSSVHQTDV